MADKELKNLENSIGKLQETLAKLEEPQVAGTETIPDELKEVGVILMLRALPGKPINWFRRNYNI